jgi:MFS family permease
MHASIHTESLAPTFSPDSERAALEREYQQRLTTLLCALGLYGAGYFVWQVPVLVDRAIAESLHETHAEVMESRSAIFFASAIGATVLGGYADTVGRRPVALISATAVVLHLLGCALCHSASQLVLCRLVGGFAMGGLAYGFAFALESAEAGAKSATALRLNTWHTLNAGLVCAIHRGCEVLRFSSDTRKLELQRAELFPNTSLLVRQVFDISWRLELAIDAALLGSCVAVTAWLVPESADFSARPRCAGQILYLGGRRLFVLK